MQPFGVQATKRGSAAHSCPRFAGCSPSTSLSTLMVSMTRCCAICFGTGNCTRIPSTRASALSSRTRPSSASSDVSADSLWSNVAMPASAAAFVLLRT